MSDRREKGGREGGQTEERTEGGGATPLHFSISLSPLPCASLFGRSFFLLPSRVQSCARIRHAVMSGAAAGGRPLRRFGSAGDRSVHISNRRRHCDRFFSSSLLFPRKSFGCLLLWSPSSFLLFVNASLFVLISLTHFFLSPYFPFSFAYVTSWDTEILTRLSFAPAPPAIS